MSLSVLHLSVYLDVQQVRQLLGLVMSLTTSCVGDKNNRKQEVVVLVQKLPESLSSRRDHGATAEQDTIHIKEDASLETGERETGEGQTGEQINYFLAPVFTW